MKRRKSILIALNFRNYEEEFSWLQTFLFPVTNF